MSDVEEFLDTCEADGLTLLGWEVWIVDHHLSFSPALAPAPAPGQWCGLIPVRGSDRPSVMGGDGDIAATRAQLQATDFVTEVQAPWLEYLRINFTIRD